VSNFNGVFKNELDHKASALELPLPSCQNRLSALLWTLTTTAHYMNVLSFEQAQVRKSCWSDWNCFKWPLLPVSSRILRRCVRITQMSFIV